MAPAVTKKELMAKAKGFTISIEKMGEKQRDRLPSGQYAEDYNKLLIFNGKLYPTLGSFCRLRLGFVARRVAPAVGQSKPLQKSIPTANRFTNFYQSKNRLKG